MQITRLLWERMASLFATNAAMLDHAAGTEVKIQFINVPFTPSLDRVLADVPAASTGLAATSISVFDAAAAEYTDVLTSERVVEFAPDGVPLVVEGAGGGSPQTLYGTRLVSHDGLTLLATQALSPNLPFNADAQNGGEIPRISFRFPQNIVR